MPAAPAVLMWLRHELSCARGAAALVALQKSAQHLSSTAPQTFVLLPTTPPADVGRLWPAALPQPQLPGRAHARGEAGGSKTAPLHCMLC